MNGGIISLQQLFVSVCALLHTGRALSLEKPLPLPKTWHYQGEQGIQDSANKVSLCSKKECSEMNLTPGPGGWNWVHW